MKLKSITDIGVHRKENQDNYWSAILTVDDKETGVICLCDGMGGLKDGGLASKMVVEAVKDSILSGMDFSDMPEVLGQANTSIFELGNRSMGTTCTLVKCSEGLYEIYHIGDTRCYLGKNSELTQLTTDHSFLGKYKGSKRPENISEEKWNKFKNCLTRCIGVKPNVQLDYYKGTYEEGEYFFVCSDGMWHHLDISKLESIGLEGLVRDCISKGETDNITAGILYM